VNPFDDLILLAPRRREASIDCGLNGDVLTALLDEFKALESLRQERGEVAQLAGARLVLSPQHGYGKSHLLARLFRALAERAVCIYLTPYADPSGGWRAVLNAAVDELCQLQNFSTVAVGEQPVPQMEFLAFNVLVSLTEQRRNAGRMSDADSRAHLTLIQTFQRDPSAWLGWLQSSGTLEHLGGELRRAGLDLEPSSRAWAQVLCRYAASPDGDDARHDAIDWLRAKPLDEEQAARLGLRPQDCPPVEATRPALNAVARERLSMLCRLARFHLPLLLCFDQIESFCHEPALTRSFGNLVCELANAQDAAGPCFPNVMAVVTANQLEWEGVVKPALYPAELQRFRPHQALYLEPPTRAQAIALVRLRLQRAGYGAATQSQFVNGPWMDACFDGERAAFGVRALLLRCQQQWEVFAAAQARSPMTAPVTAAVAAAVAAAAELPSLDDAPTPAPAPAPTLTPALAPAPAATRAAAPTVLARLEAIEQDLKHRDGALRFSGDDLTWWATQLARAQDGVAVALLDNKTNYVSATWQRGDDVIGFIIDDNSHWRRWRAIREEIQRLQGEPRGALRKAVALRTVDLDRLPGRTWSQEGEPFREALSRYLDLVVIDRAWLARIYAAREVLAEVERGKLPCAGGVAAAEQALLPTFAPLYARLFATLPAHSKALPNLPPLHAPHAPPAPHASSQPAPPTPDAAPTLRLSVTDLLSARPLPPDAASAQGADVPTPDIHDPAGVGALFHRCARALSDALIASPDAPAPGALPPLWAFFRERVLDPAPAPAPWERVQDPTQAANLQVALRALCKHLGSLGHAAPKGTRWADLLLGAEVERARAWPSPSGDVLLTGRIDALRRAPDGARVVVDYKLHDPPDASHGADPDPAAIQVAAYAWLLGADHDDAAPPVRARIEYYTPALTARDLDAAEVRRLIAEAVLPRLRAVAAQTPTSPPAPTSPTSPTSPDPTTDDPTDDLGSALDALLSVAPLDPPPSFDTRDLMRVLADYGLEAEAPDPPIEAPQVLRLRLLPKGRTTVKQIAQRASDLKVKLRLREVPFISAGTGAVDIDIPRPQARPLPWASFFSGWRAQAPCASPLALPFALAVDGAYLALDLADPGQAHALIAGTSGSGKSELLRALLTGLCARNTPDALQLTLIDPKRVTFAPLRGSPYLRDAAGEVIFDLLAAIERLEDVSAQMNATYEALSANPQGAAPTVAQVIVIDEFANLTTERALSKRFDNVVTRLTSLGRAANVHLILATQYPGHQVVGSAIKMNLPVRVCLKVPMASNSAVVLDQGGAESLLGRGDLLCMGVGADLRRGQAPLVDADTFARALRVPMR
jgi:S-DNA-T family DNA segregation ATPase FtsK/SpoIIIE